MSQSLHQETTVPSLEQTGQGKHTLDEATILNAGDSKSFLDYVFFQASPRMSHEQAQALARIVLGGLTSCVLLWLDWASGGFTPRQHLMAQLVWSYTLLSLPYYWLLKRGCNRCLWRRHLAILVDLGVISLGVYFYGASALGLYPLYLWVIIGNGLRFGLHYLHTATVVGVTGFVAATLYGGTWLLEPIITSGLLLGLLVMPRLFIALIQRLADTNQVLLRKMREAEHMASHDSLTNLPNRALLEDRLAHALKRAKRSSTHVAVIFVDLNSFKVVNDTFGHPMGDALLIQVAEKLERRLRESDTVARFGGDEFVILMEDCRGPPHVAAMVDRLSDCVGRYYSIGERQIYVSWSCGAALFPHDGADVQTLIKHADTAMFRAKSEGANQFRLYDASMSEGITARFALLTELRHATEQEQFVLYYQPQVALETGRIVGAEALIRWLHPRRGLVPPINFIPVLEQSELILDVGHWVIEQAVRDTARWRGLGLTEITISVNVSARQFMQPEFLEKLSTVLRHQQLPASALGLEMTETVLVDKTEQIAILLQKCRDLGLMLSLDDFGTGYSSLSYLKRFPFHHIKIDRSFVTDLPQDQNDGALVDAILAIGRRLGIEIIAEGVETSEQSAWLARHGCKLIQGYYASRPVPAAEFELMLRQSRILRPESMETSLQSVAGHS